MIEHLGIYVSAGHIKLCPGDILGYEGTDVLVQVVDTIHTDEVSTLESLWGCIMYRVVPGQHARLPGWLLEGGPYMHYPEDVYCWSFAFDPAHGKATSAQWSMIQQAAQDWWDIWGI